jgi:Na+:H+ antiporter, NhaC family
VFATSVVTADQYIAIVLPGRMFKGAFESRGLAPAVLTWTIGASGTPTGTLIPLNRCGAYRAATLGVATWSDLPYAIFNFASPLLAIAVAYLGVRMLRAPASPGITASAAPVAPQQRNPDNP